MTFLEPLWLLLALPLAAALWFWRPASRVLLVLRTAGFVLLLLALAGVAIELPRRDGVIVVVADRSLSMPAGADSVQRELIGALAPARDRRAPLAVVSFGATSRVEREAEGARFAELQLRAGQEGSNLHDGLETALSLVPRGTAGRILVLSDGRWTGRDPRSAALQAASRGVAVDYRVVERSTAADVAIERIDAPGSVSPGESFVIAAWIDAPFARDVQVELLRGETVLASAKQSLRAGTNRVTFRDRAPRGGTLAYSLRVHAAADDPAPENNRARFLVGVRGPKPVLVVPGSADSGFASLLRAGGLQVESHVPSQWTLESLSNHSAVVLENVPASVIGTNGMTTLASWVESAGGGLLVTGGRASFAAGGYFQSPLERVLPVSMELRREHRKLNMAIVIAMDRSGSMGMPAGGGKTKMDLANLSAVAVLDLMAPQDELGVVAVDSVAHVVADLDPIGGRTDLRRRILGVQSEGGGIFVFEALSMAARMLLTAQAQTRHIILLADAADSEEPGKYRELLQEAAQANITVTVIGLGTEKDSDAELLRDIARRGGGRCYFTDDANELPRLFAQDTFIVARSTFVEGETGIENTGSLYSLTGRSFPPLPAVGGFNLTYLREEASSSAITRDEYRAPLVASWQVGAGRVVAYTGEVDGKFTGPIARWPEVGNLHTSLVRAAAGDASALPKDVLISQRVENGVNRIELQLDPERAATSLRAPPRVVTLMGAAGEPPSTQGAEMTWRSPDELAVEIPLRGGLTYLSTVDAPGVGRVTLPPVVLPFSPELAPVRSDQGRAALERIARMTGGKERLDVGTMRGDLPREPVRVPLRSWLLLVFVVVLLLEVAERRMRISSSIALPRVVAAGPRAAQAAAVGSASVVSPPGVVAMREEEAPPAEPSADSLVDALKKAGKRAQRKM